MTPWNDLVTIDHPRAGVHGPERGVALRPRPAGAPEIPRPAAPARSAAVAPGPARVHNVWLGGRDNFFVDRYAATEVGRVAPFVVTCAHADRDFVRRAVTRLAAQGVEQFVDLGCGLPVEATLHDLVRPVAPHARVVHVDHDRYVVERMRAHLGRHEHATVMEGDLRQPEQVLGSPWLRAHLDLRRPVGVVLTGALHFVTGTAEAQRIVRRLADLVPPGSHLVLSHAADLRPATPRAGGSALEAQARAAAQAASLYGRLVQDVRLRTPGEVADLMHGWHVLEPGIVSVNRWHPRRGAVTAPLPVLGAVARLG